MSPAVRLLLERGRRLEDSAEDSEREAMRREVEAVNHRNLAERSRQEAAAMYAAAEALEPGARLEVTADWQKMQGVISTASATVHDPFWGGGYVASDGLVS